MQDDTRLYIKPSHWHGPPHNREHIAHVEWASNTPCEYPDVPTAADEAALKEQITKDLYPEDMVDDNVDPVEMAAAWSQALRQVIHPPVGEPFPGAGEEDIDPLELQRQRALGGICTRCGETLHHTVHKDWDLEQYHLFSTASWSPDAMIEVK